MDGEEDSATHAIVIDNGSKYIKSGFGGDDKPKSILNLSNSTTYPYPIERGVIVDFDKISLLWKHIFTSELHVNPKEHPLLLTELPGKSREKTMEIVFEQFEIPCYYTAPPSLLSLYASGRTTGVVVEAGAGTISVSACWEGHNPPPSSLQFGGDDITNHLQKLLIESGYQNVTKEVAEKIKENLGYVAMDPPLETKLNSDATFTLPDGKTMLVGTERFLCTEPLFNSQIFTSTTRGIHHLVVNQILNSATKMRREYCENIILSGGTSLFMGLSERLHKELIGLYALEKKIRVVVPPHREIAAWLGGSILSSLESFQTMWITKMEYEEQGSRIVHSKCF